MKKIVFLFLLIAALSAAGFAMSGSPKPPSLLANDTYCIFDVDSASFSGIKYFGVAMPSSTSYALIAQRSIISALSQKGYVYKDVIVPGQDIIMMSFNITSEVKTVTLYTDESANTQGAMFYQDYLDSQTFSNTDLSGNYTMPQARRTKVKARVESVVVWAYIFPDNNSLKEAWEGGASSIEGTSQNLPILFSKALDKFPAHTQ